MRPALILREHLASVRFLSPSLLWTAALIAFRLIQYTLESYWHKYGPWFVRPEVQISNGKLRGLTQRLPNGHRYHFFKGIPYAQPPVGELRFKPPVALEKRFESTLDCSVHRSACLQLMYPFNTLLGAEDGLFLNVYTTNLPNELDSQNRLLPVMVYLHGGAWQDGSGTAFLYNPLTLLEQDVLVVTVNYRVGPLGFLCLPEAGIYGNMGLKDQRMAFRWVRQNIAHFGGDPGNVTIFGESAGSNAAQIHYQSAESRQYFHRVIGQSISGFTHPFFQNDPTEKAKKLARLLGCKGSLPQDYYETLMTAPARQLVRMQTFVDSGETARGHVYKFYFRPVVEVRHAPERPEDVIKRYDTLTMPIMTGGNSAEGALGAFELRGRTAQYDRRPEWLVSLLLDDVVVPDRVGLGELIKRFYFGDARIDGSSVQQYCNLSSDADFLIHQTVTAEWLARNQPRVRHYLYRFDYSGRWSFMKQIFGVPAIEGACHVDDIFYLFNAYFLPKLQDKSEEAKVRNLMTKLWTNFAKYGDPTPEGHGTTVKWTPVKGCDRQGDQQFELDTLMIDQSPRMVQYPDWERLQLWRGLFRKYKKGYLYEEREETPKVS